MTSSDFSRHEYEQLLSQAVNLYFDKKYEQSLELLEKILRSPELDSQLKIRTLRRKGNTLCSLKKYPEALQVLDQGLFLAQDDPAEKCWMMACKGWCLYKLGRYEDSLHSYDQAMHLVTDKEDLEYLQFECELVLDDYEKKKKDQFIERAKSSFQNGMQQRLAMLRKEEELYSDEDFEGKPILKA
jgi:tetratricopeptide (TPR) repeat protein